MGATELLSKCIAGPCSAESESLVMETAAALRGVGVGWFRAGVWKPRTRPGCFEGPGEEGLSWLARVKKELGMSVCTEVAGADHVKACMDAGIDMVWIGARTTVNPFLVQEIAEALRGSGLPVYVKNPVNPDIELWTGAVERLRSQGVEEIGLIHRGCTSSVPLRYHNAPCWDMAVRMRNRFPQLPFICDPSHIAGCREYIAEVSQHAMDLGLDGLMIESHINPDKALSDAAQQLTPACLASTVGSLTVRGTESEDEDSRASLAELRERIDGIDEQLVSLLAGRMEVSRAIGRLKKKDNVAIVQSSRWDKVLREVKMKASSLGLDAELVERIYNEIHNASVTEQNKILSDHDS